MKILYLSWDAPPSSKGSSILAQNICEALGNSVVLVGEQQQELDEKYHNFDIEYLNPFFFNINRGYKVSRWIKFYYVFYKLVELYKKHNFSHILCVFPNEYFLLLALKLSKKFNVPLITWFHNLYFENMKGYRKVHSKILEPQIFKHSNLIFGMSDGVTNFYKKKYPYYSNKISTLQHGFKIDSYKAKINYRQSEKLNFSYTGSFHETCKDSSIRMCTSVLKNYNCILHVFGKQDKDLFKSYGIFGENVIFHGFLDDFKFHDKLKEMQIHLLPHGFYNENFSKEDIDTIFSTRTIPLMMSGIPIVTNSPPDSFFTKFLQTNDFAEVVTTKNENDIINAINLIIDNKFRREVIIENSFKCLSYFDINKVVKKINNITKQ